MSADPTPPPVPASALPQPTQHAYRWGRACAETALDEEPELTHPGHLVRHRISDAAVEAVWPIAYAAGVAAGRTAATADLAVDLLDLADRMDRRADDGDNPSDCAAMADFADELRTLARYIPAADAAARIAERTDR